MVRGSTRVGSVGEVSGCGSVLVASERVGGMVDEKGRVKFEVQWLVITSGESLGIGASWSKELPVMSGGRVEVEIGDLFAISSSLGCSSWRRRRWVLGSGRLLATRSIVIGGGWLTPWEAALEAASAEAWEALRLASMSRSRAVAWAALWFVRKSWFRAAAWEALVGEVEVQKVCHQIWVHFVVSGVVEGSQRCNHDIHCMRPSGREQASQDQQCDYFSTHHVL